MSAYRIRWPIASVTSKSGWCANRSASWRILIISVWAVSPRTNSPGQSVSSCAPSRRGAGREGPAASVRAVERPSATPHLEAFCSLMRHLKWSDHLHNRRPPTRRVLAHLITVTLKLVLKCAMIGIPLDGWMHRMVFTVVNAANRPVTIGCDPMPISNGKLPANRPHVPALHPLREPKGIELRHTRPAITTGLKRNYI